MRPHRWTVWVEVAVVVLCVTVWLSLSSTLGRGGGSSPRVGGALASVGRGISTPVSARVPFRARAHGSVRTLRVGVVTARAHRAALALRSRAVHRRSLAPRQPALPPRRAHAVAALVGAAPAVWSAPAPTRVVLAAREGRPSREHASGTCHFGHRASGRRRLRGRGECECVGEGCPTQGSVPQRTGEITEPPTPPISLVPPFATQHVLSAAELRTDAHSRTAFAAMGTNAAIALAEQTFHIEEPSWTPPGSEPGTHVIGYPGPYTATEERPGGKDVLVESTVPLDIEEGSQKVALSATLKDHGADYAPAHPLVPFTISNSSAAAVSFESGAKVAPAQADGGEAPQLVGNTLVYSNTAPDTDFMAEPLPSGVGAELSWQLRSQDSPEANALSFTLPLGAKLQLSTSTPGAAEVIQGSETLFWIPPAVAHDASGAPLPATYSVSGNQLITHVKLGEDVQFPVLVDPNIVAAGLRSWERLGRMARSGDPCGCFFSRMSPAILDLEHRNEAEISGGRVPPRSTRSGISIPIMGAYVKLTRVDVQNVETTSPWTRNHRARVFKAWIYQGGSYLSGSFWTPNGTLLAIGVMNPLSTEYFTDHDYAFCAAWRRRRRRTAAALCNENAGGEGFVFFLDAQPIGFNREWREKKKSGSVPPRFATSRANRRRFRRRARACPPVGSRLQTKTHTFGSKARTPAWV